MYVVYNDPMHPQYNMYNCNSVDYGHVTSPPHVLFMLGIRLCEKDNNSNNYNCTETAIITKVNNTGLNQ